MLNTLYTYLLDICFIDEHFISNIGNETDVHLFAYS